MFSLLDGKWLSSKQCKLVFENESVWLQLLKLKMVVSNTSICVKLHPFVWSFEGFIGFQLPISMIYFDSWFTYDFVQLLMW
jgi:hypothetical protein